jgi:hypothetical protein
MHPIARILIGTGTLFIILGILWQFGGKYLPLGKLPGDIAIEKENFRFYFPAMTSILVSLLLSGILYLFRACSR